MPAVGLLLFLFIPLVLYLFVAQPPIAGSLGWTLGLGVTLMLGHRFLARPYMRWARDHQCLWCNRVPPREPQGLVLDTAGGAMPALCCTRHQPAARRFFAFLHAWRWPLRLGIFVPLLALLGSLAWDAKNPGAAPLQAVTSLFRLVVGVSVNLAAWGYLTERRSEKDLPPSPPVPFPVHNFFLLGVGPLLWIFRLMGAWWIWQGARGLAGL